MSGEIDGDGNQAEMPPGEQQGYGERMADREDDAPERTPAEGVRIIGAEEAQKALEGGHASGRLGDDELRFGDVPPRPDPDAKTAVRFPLPDGESPALGARSPANLSPPEPQLDLTSGAPASSGSPSAGPSAPPVSTPPPSAPAASAPPPTAPAASTPRPSAPAATGPSPDAPPAKPLPHWTEPATGEVPRILPESEVTSTVPPAAPGDDDDLAVWSRFTSAPRYRDQPSDWADRDFAPGDLGDESTKVGALRERVDPDDEFDAAVAQRRPRRRPKAPAAEAPRRRAGLEPDLAPDEAPPPAREGRDLPTAIVVGLAIGVGALLIFKWGRFPTAVLVAVIAAMAVAELFAAVRQHGYQPAALLGIIGSSAIVLATYWRGERGYPLVIVLTAVFTLLWYLVQVVQARPTINVAMTFVGFGYVGVLAGFAGLMLNNPDGIGMLLGVVLPAVAYDVAGYGVGSTMGRRKLAPAISPNKTVEGLAGGVLASVLVAAIGVGFIAPWNHTNGILLGLVVATFAFVGDLCESMFKRDLGVKDLGGLLPGHGGVLDRFDAILFALPAAYYLALVLKLT